MDEGLGNRTSRNPKAGLESTQEACQRLCREAWNALVAGATGHAGKLVQQAVDRANDPTLLGDARVALRLNTLGAAVSICEISGSLAESWEYIEQAIVVAASGSDTWARALYALQVRSAGLLSSMDRHAEAESRWANTVIQSAERSGELPLLVDARLSFAAFLWRRGRDLDAGREASMAFGLLPRVEPADGVEVSTILMKHAVSMGEEGRFRDAARLSGEVFRRLGDWLAGKESPIAREFLSDARLRHAELLVKAGEVGVGREVYQAVLSDFSESLEATDPKLAQVRDTVSMFEAELGNFERAHALAKENLDTAIEAGDDNFERLARSRISSIFLMQGRRRDAYEIVAEVEASDEFDAEASNLEPQSEDETEGMSLKEALDMVERLPMPARVLSKVHVLRQGALELVDEDPEEALRLVNQAEDELSVLAPALTAGITASLAEARALAVASLGGLPKLIEFLEKNIAEFEKENGCSAEMTRHALRGDLAELYIHSDNFQAAEEILRDIVAFFERRQVKESLLYGVTLTRLADIVSDETEAETLRSQGKRIIDSFRDQVDLD